MANSKINELYHPHNISTTHAGHAGVGLESRNKLHAKRSAEPRLHTDDVLFFFNIHGSDFWFVPKKILKIIEKYKCFWKINLF